MATSRHIGGSGEPASRAVRGGGQSIELRQQIARGTTPMFGRVVDHVAALAERSELAGRIVGWIVLQVCARDIDARDAHDRGDISLSE